MGAKIYLRRFYHHAKKSVMHSNTSVFNLIYQISFSIKPREQKTEDYKRYSRYQRTEWIQFRNFHGWSLLRSHVIVGVDIKRTRVTNIQYTLVKRSPLELCSYVHVSYCLSNREPPGRGSTIFCVRDCSSRLELQRGKPFTRPLDNAWDTQRRRRW